MSIQKESGRKWGSVFLKFSVSILSGLSVYAQVAIADRYELELPDIGGDHIGRRCGEYMQGLTFSIKGATLPELAHLLQGLKDTDVYIGKPMIGCFPKEFKVYTEAWPIVVVIADDDEGVFKVVFDSDFR